MPEGNDDPAGTCAAFIRLIDEQQAIASEPWDKDALTVVFGKGESARPANVRTQKREAERLHRLDGTRARLQAMVPDVLGLIRTLHVGNAAAITRYVQTWTHSDAMEAKGTAMELAAALRSAKPTWEHLKQQTRDAQGQLRWPERPYGTVWSQPQPGGLVQPEPAMIPPPNGLPALLAELLPGFDSERPDWPALRAKLAAGHSRTDREWEQVTLADLAAGAAEQQQPRRGRLSKEESDAKRATMLATIRQHPSLKDDPAKLAQDVGVSESTVRRWLDDEERKYRESRPARPVPAEE